MREIKFRGKTICEQPRWAYGSLIQYEDGSADIHGIDIFKDGDNILIFTQVDPATVGQYTGLKDKNGKEIYEGDVLKTQFSSKKFGIVTWHDKGYFFVDTSFGEWRCFGYRFISIADLMDKQIRGERVQFKVIGNICDNPELLERE